MKVSEARDMSIDEARQKIVALKQELFNLRFQHAVGQLENPQKMKQTKRDIARLFTVIRETETQNNSDQN